MGNAFQANVLASRPSTFQLFVCKLLTFHISKKATGLGCDLGGRGKGFEKLQFSCAIVYMPRKCTSLKNKPAGVVHSDSISVNELHFFLHHKIYNVTLSFRAFWRAYHSDNVDKSLPASQLRWLFNLLFNLSFCWKWQTYV